MGIFKRLLRKEIYLENSCHGELVHPLSSKKLKIGSTVKVPEGYAFVLGYNGKVYDVFEQGESKLDLINIPEAVKRFKLNKPDKNGKFAKKIKINGYYVNLNDFIFPWQTYRKMVFKDESLGYFKGKANGEIVVKVENPKLFIKALLTEYSYLKKGEGKKITLSFISEFITLYIEKQNYDIIKLINNSSEITNQVKNALENKFSKYGLKIQNLYIRGFILPKKLQENIVTNSYSLDTLDNIQEQLEEPTCKVEEKQKSAFTDYGINVEEESIDTNNNVEIEENPLISSFYDYKDESFYEDYKDNNFETTPYEITNPFKNEEKTSSEQEIEEKINEPSVWGNYENWNIDKKDKNTKPKFVDLNLETLYDDKKEI